MDFSFLSFILGIANQGTNAIYEATYGKSLRNKLSQIRKRINEDSDLKNQLIEAYNARDQKLLNAALASVPGGLNKKYNDLAREIRQYVHSKYTKELDTNIANNTEKLAQGESRLPNQYNQIQNAISAAEYNNSGNYFDPTKHRIDTKKKHTMKDQYGNVRHFSDSDLIKFTYGEPKTSKPTYSNMSREQDLRSNINYQRKA